MTAEPPGAPDASPVPAAPLDTSPVPDYAALHRLDGRGLVLLGAGNGIGRQTAHALAAGGARVLCVDVDGERARAVAAETGGIPYTADVTRREPMRELFAEAPRLLGGRPVGGVVDIVGMARYAALPELDDAGWDWHFDLVLRHAWLAVQYGGEAVAAAGGGPLVFVASVSGLTAAPLHAAYGAAKAGLMSLVRSAAVELGPRGVRVNAVAPGVVRTPRVAALLGTEGRRRNAENAPLGRVAETADIAAALYFLASPQSSYITGQTLVVDGGVGVKFPYPTIGGEQ
ncbi:SDR family oxidoreductase [Streptomyces sp. ISL-43]|uniref:SDR family NAD(P)-dependent oxidoreductase n=1 Tax=Streptomyces sp. ISL-43 TaxID=2819183 RepID=UPI001BE5A9C0|nr:SDR family oxidoreductase [Streptomyces sp. ISL-43]MBT2447345.1 SDR family oxidoreductase [Streptomyces sp. ISL-43]